MVVIYFNKNTLGLSEPLKKCVEFIKKAESQDVELGRHNLENGIYCSLIETDSSFNTHDFYEAHRKYVDVHYVIDGEYFMSVGDIDKMDFDSYTEEKDFVKLFGNPIMDIPMNSGFGLVVFPNDAHIAKQNNETKKEKIKKIIFKVPVELFEGCRK